MKDSMTVGELRDELEDYGDHVPVKVVRTTPHRDILYPIQSVGTYNTKEATIVQIEIGDAEDWA